MQILAAAVALAGCAAQSVEQPARSPSSGRPTSTSNSTSPSAAAHPQGALARLAAVPIKGRAPKTGYARARFGPAWTDDSSAPDGHNGCDTRNDVLRHDLLDVALKPDTHGCVVLAGTLRDPYLGTTISFVRGVGTSNAVQIDHVVALGDAWQTGAQQWDAAKRVAFANDPLNLLAVDQHSNEQKRDADAASWLPHNKAYRCAYVARQVAVKARYGLWVTQPEHDAIAGVLRDCPGQ